MRTETRREERLAWAEHNLRVAVRQFGPKSEQAKEWAMEVCHMAGMDPNFKYAVYPSLTTRPIPEPKTPFEAAPYEYEWERLVKRAAQR